ncbi:MAG: hypothetical protein M1485_05280 [Chloroflexi bacterium]|nr:hypothetical protein [Chloroflexota bacterium]
MSKSIMWFKKIVVVAVVAGLGLSALPLASAFALGLNDAAAPPAPGQISNARLGQIWAREQVVNQRLGAMFVRSDPMLATAQKLIDRAKANGKDVSAVQSALDALAAAIQQAKPVYDAGQSVISSHQGFDSVGNVTDVTQAKATVRSVRDMFKQISQIVQGPRKALREAVKAFRDANRPAGTSAPAQSGG